jgi:very-short-patch-repair endonuclease
MDRFCVICGKLLTGRQTVLCSDKECHRERQKDYECRYRQSNPEKIKEKGRKYYQNNLEKKKESSRKYRQDNPEKAKKQSSEYRQNNSEKIKKQKYMKYRFDRGLSEDADLYKESSIERIMRGWLQKNNIEFIAQYYINLENSTWTHVDFFIEPNICLYVDGNYYHLLPNAKKCDENQNRILPQMGYNVIRLSEVEILNGIRPNLILAD